MSDGDWRQNHRGQELLHDDAILGEIVGRLAKAYQPERIYLFGSAIPASRTALRATKPNRHWPLPGRFTRLSSIAFRRRCTREQ